jgi:hypothetical protein
VTRRRILIGALVLVGFVLGVGFGRALGDNPEPGGQQTLIRTLRPLPLAPAARETVTVTVQKE